MDGPVDVLLIEDEAHIAEAIRFILTRAGHAVAHRAEGGGALAAIAAARPRLVVLDLMLPGRSGAEILRDLRGAPDPALAATPVLMLTARGQPEGLAPGADAYLAKPFDNAALRDLVARLLR